MLERGDHVGDGVVKCGFVVEVGLPEPGEELEVIVPAALVEAFADGIGNVAAAGNAAIRVGW